MAAGCLVRGRLGSAVAWGLGAARVGLRGRLLRASAAVWGFSAAGSGKAWEAAGARSGAARASGAAGGGVASEVGGSVGVPGGHLGPLCSGFDGGWCRGGHGVGLGKGVFWGKGGGQPWCCWGWAVQGKAGEALGWWWGAALGLAKA